MIAAVVMGEHIVAIGAAGVAHVPTGRPMEADMIFNIGSNTKSMAALLLSMVIEQTPELSWDSTLAEALPWSSSPVGSYIWPAERRSVTLAQLVSHRSGFDCTNQAFDHVKYVSGWRDLTRPEVLTAFVRGPAMAESGDEPTGLLADCQGTIGVSDYDNVNFTIVQAVIDAWADEPFYEYARSALFEPHGMDRTYLPAQTHLVAQCDSIMGTASQRAYWNPYFFHCEHPRLAADRYAWGHGSTNVPSGLLHPDTTPWGVSPASGGFAFDIQDWSRYAILHLRPRTTAVLNAQRATFEGYNYGWGMAEASTPGGITFPTLCHSGALSGQRSRICVYPTMDVAYLAFANGGPRVGDAVNAVISWMASHEDLDGDAGGCADDPAVRAVQRFAGGQMFGCAGSVRYAERASICGAGSHVCSSIEFADHNRYGDRTDVEAPAYHYWVDDAPGLELAADGACTVSPNAATCGAETPARVCTPDRAPGSGDAGPTVDRLGNRCTVTHCALDDDSGSAGRYFGGCQTEDDRAGALCCRD